MRHGRDQDRVLGAIGTEVKGFELWGATSVIIATTGAALDFVAGMNGYGESVRSSLPDSCFVRVHRFPDRLTIFAGLVAALGTGLGDLALLWMA